MGNVINAVGVFKERRRAHSKPLYVRVRVCRPLWIPWALWKWWDPYIGREGVGTPIGNEWYSVEFNTNSAVTVRRYYQTQLDLLLDP